MNQAVNQMTAGSPTAEPRHRPLWYSAVITVVLIGIWCFPGVWYSQSDSRLGYYWLGEQTNITGWAYREIPVGKAAEAALVADRLVNGEFTTVSGTAVRVFSAKRYVESQNEIGLFVHTPDRCWTEGGWQMDPVQPEYRELMVHGIQIAFERRVFVTGAQRELVYFAGMVGGQPLPYRLDHNLSIGMKHALRAGRDQTGTTLRASDRRFWSRLWDAFWARRPLAGPKQFLRISTPIRQGEIASADAVLEEFLPHWLSAIEYDQELVAWLESNRRD